MMMVDDAIPEELWQRIAEESPHTSDDEIERLFIATAKAKQDFIRQITEWVFERPASKTLRADSRAVSFPWMQLKD
jgi:hypothetical protein